eukprot:TRINITY_DN5896_c0_g1_i2.p1 TRINITY_DN5896_c0_g1~~TRINITY_DN5896_c0_g1_i2.p1  ORF type:complete len:150 (-),score=21.34 TRINITY_DN5896_c0_g1_i2:1009-1458(-)
MDHTRSGRVSMHEFMEALDLPPNETNLKVYRLIDVSERGYIVFRELVVGLLFISKHPHFLSSVEAAFEAADVDQDGALSPKEANTSLKTLFPEITDSHIRRLFQRMDLDRDGSISWVDFKTFLETNPEYLAAMLFANPKLARAPSPSSA